MIKIDQSETINLNLFDYLVKSHALSEHGYHGPDHWLRVLQNGRLLTPLTGANLRVVELFALIHDSKRINENIDPEHGPRAALFAASSSAFAFASAILLSAASLAFLSFAFLAEASAICIILLEASSLSFLELTSASALANSFASF